MHLFANYAIRLRIHFDTIICVGWMKKRRIVSRTSWIEGAGAPGAPGIPGVGIIGVLTSERGITPKVGIAPIRGIAFARGISLVGGTIRSSECGLWKARILC